MTRKPASVFVRVGRVLRLMLGAPDYERYVEHVRTAHPDSRPISRSQFEKERLDARYSRPGARCC